MSVSVTPVQRKALFPCRLHVLKEIHKVQPSLTNLYSPASITMVHLVLFVGASLKHSPPKAIERVLSISRTMAMYGFSLSRHLALITATGFGDPRSEPVSLDYCRVFTDAFAQPKYFGSRMDTSALMEAFYREPTKNQSS